MSKRREIGVSFLKMQTIEKKSRVRFDNPKILEKLWVNELATRGDYYSACYVKRWYNLVPKLRLMTNNDGVVETASWNEVITGIK